MQVRKDFEIIDAKTGEPKDLADELADRIESGEADSGTIAKLPENGTEVTINGLEFEVQQITKSGNVILELKGK